MPKFIITRTIKHTEVAEVEAVDKWEALEKVGEHEYIAQPDAVIYDGKIEEAK